MEEPTIFALRSFCLRPLGKMNSSTKKNKIVGEKGIALVLTLLILTVLVVTGLELNRAVRVEATLAGNFRDLTQAGYIAQSGVEIARALIKEDDPAYDSWQDKWAQFENLSFLSANFFPEGHFTGRITDEAGKFNLNGLVDSSTQLVDAKKKEQLERLLYVLGQPADWVEALLDWLDTDDQPRTRGAERDYYSSLKKPYPAKNGDLNSIEELLLLKGMEPGILYGKEGREGLRDYVTVHSEGKININTASLPVLMSLSPSVTKTMAQAVLDYRRLTPFKTLNDLLSVPGWGTVLPQISFYITVKSNYFAVEIIGNYREARSVVQTVVRRDGSRTTLLFWKAG